MVRPRAARGILIVTQGRISWLKPAGVMTRAQTSST